MADNFPFTPGTGATGAADDVGGVLYPRVKAVWGPDGTVNDTDVATGKPMPIQLRSATGLIPVGEPTDAKNAATDTTSVALIPLAKQISQNGQDTVAKLASFSASATFTPAAASHLAGDCNGAAQEFTSMGNSAGRIMINSASLQIDGGTAEATAWRLALFNITPPSAVADDSPHTLPSGDRASFLGFIELGTAIDEVDTQWVETHGIQKQVKLAGTSLFAYLINRTTLTPANVAHIVTLHATAL